jgi:hypothetical protein
MDATKTCARCKQTKPVEDFYSNGPSHRHTDGSLALKSRCKTCYQETKWQRTRESHRKFRDWTPTDLYSFVDDMENVVKCLVAWRNRVAPEEGRMLGQAAQLIQFAKDFSEEKRHEQKQKKHWSSVS